MEATRVVVEGKKAKHLLRKGLKKHNFFRGRFSLFTVVVFAVVFGISGIYIFFKSNAAVTVTQPPLAAAPGKQWQLNFFEEFEGTDYDHNKLTPCFDWNIGNCTESFNHGRERYLPSQVQVNNGSAKLVAEPLSPPYADSSCFNGSCTYKAGLLSTARPLSTNGSNYLYTFTYGYVESRVKFPATQGFFTAFWMLPANPDYTANTEIDIVEILGDDPSSIFMTYHYNGRNTSYHVGGGGVHNNGACAVKDYSKDWVTFGMDWQPDHIAWYIDGVKCGQFNGNSSTIESHPMEIIEHMMVGNDWQRSWGKDLLDPTLTRQLEVDYLRVWQQVPATGDTTPPTVSISAPTSGSTVSGASVTLSANASDNVGVSGVQFKLDGANLNTEDTTSPYSTTWNTTTTTNGTHTLTAVARDAAGNTTTSSSVSVTVNNTSPTPTATISANPTSISSGSSSTLTWSSTNATSCTASNGWSGTKATSGTQSVSPTATTTYSLTCTGAGGTSSPSSTTVTVTVATKPGDFNNDNNVNIFDLSIMLTNYGKTTAQSSNPACDMNSDGTINIFDLSAFLSRYGT